MRAVGSTKSWIIKAGRFALLALFSSPAYASFSLDPSSFSNIQALLSDEVAGPIIRTIGFATDHRAYEGASGLGNSAGFDLSAQVILVKLPKEFLNSLSEAGMSNLPVDVAPIPRLILHKGLGDRVDVGVSWIIFKEVQITGVDVKLVTYQPEEGPTWAARLNYTWSRLDFSDSGSSINVHTQTFKPEILVSQKLDFAEPYLGVGYQFTHGTLEVQAVVPGVGSFDDTMSAHGAGGLAFIGIGLKVPGIPMRLLIDGEYSTVGADALGAKFGFNF